MSNEAPGNTLQATALVHEAYLKLVGADGIEWASRAHLRARVQITSSSAVATEAGGRAQLTHPRGTGR